MYTIILYSKVNYIYEELRCMHSIYLLGWVRWEITQSPSIIVRGIEEINKYRWIMYCMYKWKTYSKIKRNLLFQLGCHSSKIWWPIWRIYFSKSKIKGFWRQSKLSKRLIPHLLVTLELELVQKRGQEEGGDVLCDPVAHAPTLAERKGLKVARFLELSILDKSLRIV